MPPKPGTVKRKSKTQKRKRSVRRAKKRIITAEDTLTKKLVKQMSAKLDVLFEMQVKLETIKKILPISKKRYADFKGMIARGNIVDKLVESITTMQREKAMLGHIIPVYTKELEMLRKELEGASGKKISSSPRRIIAELRGMLRNEKADPEYLFKSEAEKSLPKNVKTKIAKERKRALDSYKKIIEWMSERFAMKRRGLSEEQKKHAMSLEQSIMLFSFTLADNLNVIKKLVQEGKK